MPRFVVVRPFTSEESDPRWAHRSGMPMQIRMGQEHARLHLTAVIVERSGFTRFEGTLDGKPVEGFYGIKERGPIHRLLSGFGVVMMRAVLLMVIPSILFLV